MERVYKPSRRSKPVMGSFSRALAKLPNFAAISEQARRDKLWVLPACQDRSEKHPCIKWKKYQSRQPTDDEIASLCRCYAYRNGIYLTGPFLGRFVVDCDDASAVAWLRRKGVPRTQQVVTARCRHFHFAYPEAIHVRNSAGLIHKGVDIRGAGGVAVAVGSLHHSGFRYEWARGCSPRDVKLAEAPSWLLDWVREKYSDRRKTADSAIVSIVLKPFSGCVSPWAQAAIDRELLELRKAVPGTRNNALARIAFKFGQFVAGGEADRDELIAAIYGIARVWPNQQKSRDTIVRAFNAGTAHPRMTPSILSALAKLG
jgi:hypothetical protein